MQLHTTADYSNKLKVLLVLPLAYLFIFVALNNQNIILILFPIFLLLIVIQRELNSFHEIQDKLIVTRSFSTTKVIEENIITVTLEIRNNADVDSHLISLEDDIPSNFAIIDSTNKFLFNLKKKEKLELTYKIKSLEIGIYEFNKINIVHNDLFGLITETFEIEPPKERIRVIPKIEKFENVPVFPYWMKFFNGYFKSKQFGNDNDFMGIKEFQYGDRLKRINWKVSSKYQMSQSHYLYSNYYNLDKAIDTELILDLTFESGSVYSELIRTVCSFAEFLLRNRNKIGLTIARQNVEYMKVNMGIRQLQKITDKLINTKVDYKLNDPIIIDRLLHTSLNYNRKSVLIVISPMINQFIVEYCKKIKLNGFSVIILNVNTLDRQLRDIQTGTYEKTIPLTIPLFFNIVSFDFMVQNYLSKDKLLSLSIPILEWNPDQSLKEFLARSRKQIRI